MGSNLVIVAVPDENDRVWKVSSEKVPHLTILHLGDSEQVSNLESIVQFVEHAVSTSLKRFYLPVDRRGELGDAKADVLFFKKGRYDFKAIRDFRSLLLKDSNIKTAYDATSQFEFPEHVGAPGQPWIPHLTLGYPETPANKVSDDQIAQFYDVQFNKIAVWTGDYEGPEFLIKDYWDDIEELGIPMDVAMSDIQHFGTKGMRWGVRKDRHGRDRFDPAGHKTGDDIAKAFVLPPGLSAPAHVRLGKRAVRGTKAYMEKRKQPEEVAKRAARKLARKDFYWEMHAYSDISHADLHNKVADEIDSKVYQLQTAPKYRGKNLKTDKKLSDEYDQDVAKVTDASYRRAVKDTYGVNPSGTKEARYVNDARGARIEIRDKATGKTLSEKDLNPIQEDIKDEVGHSALVHTGLLHADKFDEPLITITVKTNAEGFITEIGRVKLPEDEGSELAQTVDLGAEFLAHYGIKGMRWGVRREAPTAVAPTATSVVPRGARRKTKIKTEGGENHEAHEDAIKVARAQAKLKKSGPAALSNQELAELQNRLNLERNVATLTSVANTGRLGRGRAFVRNITGVNRELNDTVGTGLQTKRLVDQMR